MSTIQCEYCHKAFVNKYTLASHLKRAKFCIDIQRKLNIEVIEEFKICEFCSLKCSPTSYEKHLTRCKVKKTHYFKDVEDTLKTQLTDKDTEIKTLKDSVAKQADTIEDLNLQVSTLKSQVVLLRALKIEAQETTQVYKNRVHYLEEQAKTTLVKPTYNTSSICEDTTLLDLTSQMIDTGEIKTPIQFAQKFMFALESPEQFPVDASLLIEWGVYDRKDNMKTKLLNNFSDGIDYQVQNLVPEFSGTKNPKPQQQITLTTECFKAICMMSNNDMGKKVRTYYLDLEKVFKRYVTLQHEEQLEKEQDKLLKLTTKYNKLLRNKKRSVFDKGNVVYIVSHNAFDAYHGISYFKIGKATQKSNESVAAFTSRLSTYNTCAPSNYNVHYVVYLENNSVVENVLKEKFRHQLDPSNKEWIKGVLVTDIIDTIRDVCSLMNMEYKDFEYQPSLSAKQCDQNKVSEIESECRSSTTVSELDTMDSVSVY